VPLVFATGDRKFKYLLILHNEGAVNRVPCACVMILTCADRLGQWSGNARVAKHWKRQSGGITCYCMVRFLLWIVC
jgi:hypothetical protein